MFRHIVMWNLNEDATMENAKEVKALLENLKNLVPEVVDIKVYIDPIPPYSNRVMMLDARFADEKDFLTYMTNADHKAAGETVIKYVTDRAVFDYYE